MDVHEILETISGRLSASATAKNVYGDPVTAGNRTVIPVAKIRYGFGGGGGEDKAKEGQGGGGGGGVIAVPCGALEITPEGARFIGFPNDARVIRAVVAGFILGALLTRLARRGRR